MRMRKKKYAKERIAKCGQLFLPDPKEYRGKWKELFGNDYPVIIEIGCGKGAFMLQTAKLHSNINYLAIEKCVDCLVIALESAAACHLTNVRFSDLNAEEVEEVFEPGECGGIYLNFSDPWPKTKQAKRRLTHSSFLKKYRRILAEDGAIYFKTDNTALFDFSIGEFEKEQWTLSHLTYDLHNSGFEGNIMTEYETNFTQKGFPICRVEARKN